MNISIKSNSDILKMRIANRLAAEVLEMIAQYIKPGISTGEIDDICSKYITNKQNAISAILGYQGFPKSICTSVNDVVCHGIPNFNEILKDGDIINIDIAIIKYGFYGDTSTMFIVGKPNKEGKNLCKIAQKSLYKAISIVKPGIRLYTLGETIQKFVESKNYSTVREYCGHGIGTKFHEEPHIFHYKTYDNGITLKPGMTFTIEPMINAGECYTYISQDGWTVKTRDNSISAQYEHTILVTDDGYEIMTLRCNEKIF